MKKTLLTALLALTLGSQLPTEAQEIGTWKAYMAYHDITDIQQGGQTLYVLASDNLYTYNQNDQSLQTFDKANGLSDCSISFIRWNDTAKKLIIVYANGNIDFMDSKGEVTNLSDYYSKAMTDDKTINEVDIIGQYAYLSTNFGIVKVDMSKEQVSETYNLGITVNYVYQSDGYLYAASQASGNYRGLLTDNLIDRSSWTSVGGYADRSRTIDADLLATVQTLSPGGPKYNHFGYMKFKNNRLYTVEGGYTDAMDAAYPGTVQVLDGDEWTIYEDEDIEQKTGHAYRCTSSIDVDPTDASHVAVGARTGLYEFKDGKLLHHWYSGNSTLYGASGSGNYTLVLGTAYDQAGSLWCFNSLSPTTTLMEYTKDGNWVNHHSSQLVYNDRGLARGRDLMFDSRGLLWLVNNHYWQPSLVCYQPSTSGLAVYKSFVNQDGSSVAPNYVRCVTEDKDGNIWIGTNVGPLVLESSSIGQAADETTFTQVKVPRNDGTNYADYLLTGIDITCMAIDGGGRKWFGTNSNGLYLISEDNNTQLQHFLSTNSPLLSDNIESLAINGATGEVYIGTDKGLCSYKSDATDPVDEMNKDVTYAYPNPVTPDYTGLITVVGLTYDAEVMITTSNGVLVAKGRSNGGTFTWDGCDQQGKRVASGVYMVQTATQDGSKGTVCKIAIVR